MNKTILAIALLTTAFSASAEYTTEKWDCKKNGKVAVTLDFNTQTGETLVDAKIRIGTVLQDAYTHLDGLDREWMGTVVGDNWLFVITPDNRGLYYAELSPTEAREPSSRYTCKLR